MYQAVQYKACALILKTTAFFVDQLCIVPFGLLFPRFPQEGGGSRQVEWSPHTFAVISRATDIRFLNVFYIIRFVFPLAFQCRIQNSSTEKTREDIAKRKRKVENDGKGGG